MINQFAVKTIKEIQESTSSKGINFFVLMSDKDNLSNSKSENFYPNLEQMKKIYSGWEVLTEIQDYTDIENHDNLGEHRHNLIFIVFRKH